MIKYPIGQQDFRNIRRDNYIYVDKTDFVEKLVSEGKYYFLSRPRRFGKSLLLSTIDYFFRAEKDLFKGLKIYDSDIEWIKYPVIHLDLNVKNYKDISSLEEILVSLLIPLEKEYGIDNYSRPIEDRFYNLIYQMYLKTGRQVVVLVDEYDKPLISSIENEQLHDEYQAVLKGFFSVLKSADKYLKFVMLSGVSRFSKVSVFRDLNHLRDISMLDDFETICGITEQELHQNFETGVVELAKKLNKSIEDTYSLLKYYYDGYHFSTRLKDVYNPFSLLNALANRQISNYWFESGTPTFLISSLKSGNYDLEKLDGEIETMPAHLLKGPSSSFDAIPLLYQSGYLTIKKIDDFFGSVFLGYPNKEVEDSFISGLLPVYGDTSEDRSISLINQMVRDVINGNVDSFMRSIQSMLAKVPAHINDDALLELHYHNMMYLISYMIGLKVHTEYHTSNGRIDMLVETRDYIYILEFKSNVSAQTAMKQIDDKQYILPFKADGRSIIKIGASFSKATRTLSDWTISTVE